MRCFADYNLSPDPSDRSQLPPAWVIGLGRQAAGRFGRDAEDDDPFDPGPFDDLPDDPLPQEGPQLPADDDDEGFPF